MSIKKITVKNLIQTYGNSGPPALDNVSIDFPINKITAIVGPSASGKTSLLEHLNGISVPESGSIQIDEFIINKKQKKFSYVKQIRQKIGFLFQFPEQQLFMDTVKEDVLFGPSNFGMAEQKGMNEAKKYFKFFNLPLSYLPRSPFELSGGEKRKAAMIGVFAYDPEIILIDQPTRGLDIHTSKNFLNLILKMKNNQHKTIIFCGQDTNEILQVADLVVVMKKGKITNQLSPVELFSNPKLCHSIGLKLPKVVTFFNKLKSKNFFSKDIFLKTKSELVAEIIKTIKLSKKTIKQYV